MSECIIYLLRHGEIDQQGVKRFVGQVNFPLTEKGRRQAEQWRRCWTCLDFQHIYCSDLGRCRETAEIIARDRHGPVEARSLLREIHLGQWDGLPMAEVRKRLPHAWWKRGQELVSFRPPGGESFADLHTRVIPLFDKIAKEGKGPILIVGHAGVNRVILCHVLGMPLENLFRLGQDYGAVSLIDCGRDPWQLVALNKRPNDLPTDSPKLPCS